MEDWHNPLWSTNFGWKHLSSLPLGLASNWRISEVVLLSVRQISLFCMDSSEVGSDWRHENSSSSCISSSSPLISGHPLYSANTYIFCYRLQLQNDISRLHRAYEWVLPFCLYKSLPLGCLFSTERWCCTSISQNTGALGMLLTASDGWCSSNTLSLTIFPCSDFP